MVLKIGRTAANLAGCEQVQFEHIAEVIQFRLAVVGMMLLPDSWALR
jgi:predicted ATPase with chaperone activity